MSNKRVLLVGASGTIGQAVAKAGEGRWQLVTAGLNSGQHRVDLTRSASIRAMFEAVGRVDAIIATAGKLHFGPLTEMTAEQFSIGLNDKLLGQVNLALIGQHHLNDGGSITLTSGIVAQVPIRMGANASTVNSALDGFVAGAACELGRGQRINVVSPTVLVESLAAYGAFFQGFEPAPGPRVAQAYLRSVEGVQTGQVFKVW
jgi:NAD(P)-dependent dehydrogenase (short-subunit alcohol dehydrogenase family)